MPNFAPFEQDEFVAAVRGLAAQIGSDGWSPDFIIGIGRGGLAPAVFLSHATGVPMLSVDVSAPVPEFNGELLAKLAERTRSGERLLFVDDINDSGRTISALRAGLRAAGGDIDATRFAVLIDNVSSAERVEYGHRHIDRATNKDWFVFPWEAMAPAAALAEDAAEVLNVLHKQSVQHRDSFAEPTIVWFVQHIRSQGVPRPRRAAVRRQ